MTEVCHGCGGESDVPYDATGKPACGRCYVCDCPVCRPPKENSGRTEIFLIGFFTGAIFMAVVAIILMQL